MTHFLDGPAKDVKLMLKRAPRYLRAVQSPDGKWDALDMLEDNPREGESVFVYRMLGEPTWIHVRATRGRGGIYRGGQYRLVDPQPSWEAVWTTAAWRAWVLAQAGTTPEEKQNALAAVWQQDVAAGPREE